MIETSDENERNHQIHENAVNFRSKIKPRPSEQTRAAHFTKASRWANSDGKALMTLKHLCTHRRVYRRGEANGLLPQQKPLRG